ncbi:hypothetical protein OG871_39980 (plasmid) [Kitasatospora sp. NBC_00374]|uniref:hypothetical protein n=1 Tax=Kitasatospora sp. NBC_00374 TaxID=2975964 RepID=UPI002F913994
MTNAAANKLCGTVHYRWAAACTLPVGHDGPWHRGRHPETAVEIRYQALPHAWHTQEWVPDDDLDAEPGSGQWTTLHYGKPGVRGPSSTVPEDLDRRVMWVVGGHIFTSLTRSGVRGPEEECSCGAWYPAGQHSQHVGQWVGRLVRGYFDMGLKAGADAAAAERNR